MQTIVKKLDQLKPVKFPQSSGAGQKVYKIERTSGLPTKKVIAEIKRLSKKDIYQFE